MKTIIGLVIFITIQVSAETKPKSKSHKNPNSQSIKLTSSEQETVKRAKIVFKDSLKQSPPSAHMRDKMQSGMWEQGD